MKSATKKKATPVAHKTTKPAAKLKTAKLKLVAGTALVPFPLKPEFTVGAEKIIEKFTGLEWTKQEFLFDDQEAAEKAVAECRIGGHSDWRLERLYEQQVRVDYTQSEPATYEVLRPITRTGRRHITCEKVKGYEASLVWGVHFRRGDVSGYSVDRSISGFCRFVRGGVAAPGQ